MSLTSIVMNLLWLVFGGWSTALSWFTSAFFMLISIVGIPWARAAFNIGLLNFWPFGSQVVNRKKLSGSDIGTSGLGTIGNILWFIFCGWWLALIHLFWELYWESPSSVFPLPFSISNLREFPSHLSVNR